MRTVRVLGVVLALATPAVAEESPRLQGGLQLGGANVVLLDLRVRVLDRVYVEGGFAVFPVLTALGSLGVVLEQPIGARWSVHLAAGASGIFDVSEHSCERADGPDCWDQFDARFVYARIGVAIRWSVDTPAEPRQRKLALDVGLWRGEARYRAGTRLRDRDRFMTPMAGLTYLFL